MNDDIAANAPKEGAYLANDELWRKVPAFRYDAPAAGHVFAQQGGGLAVLAAWCAVAAALAVWRVRRVEVQ
jgi:hypothetical protein